MENKNNEITIKVNADIDETIEKLEKTKKLLEEIDLKTVSTFALVKELKLRAGVETIIAEPYQDVEVKANGPAIILKIID